jgi:hypothetical protein
MWNFRNSRKLDKAGILSAYLEQDEDDNAADNGTRKYFRFLRSYDVTSEERKVENTLKEVFNNLAMLVIVQEKPIEDSDVAAWIESLRKVPNLHFES